MSSCSIPPGVQTQLLSWAPNVHVVILGHKSIGHIYNACWPFVTWPIQNNLVLTMNQHTSALTSLLHVILCSIARQSMPRLCLVTSITVGSNKTLFSVCMKLLLQVVGAVL